MNLWFLIDIGSGLCYGWCGRVYRLQGVDDAEKIRLLQQLAETDYATAQREPFPKQWRVERGGHTLEAHLTPAQINLTLAQHLDFFARVLEAGLPPLPVYQIDGTPASHPTSQRLPTEPLYVATLLMENDRGEMRPYTTPGNKAWADAERLRLM